MLRYFDVLQLAAQRPVARSDVTDVDAAVFQHAHIPRKLDEIENFERDAATLARGGGDGHIFFQTIAGLARDGTGAANATEVPAVLQNALRERDAAHAHRTEDKSDIEEADANAAQPRGPAAAHARPSGSAERVSADADSSGAAQQVLAAAAASQANGTKGAGDAHRCMLAQPTCRSSDSDATLCSDDAASRTSSSSDSASEEDAEASAHSHVGKSEGGVLNKEALKQARKEHKREVKADKAEKRASKVPKKVKKKAEKKGKFRK